MKKLFVPKYNGSTGVLESWEPVTRPTLKDIYRELCSRLSDDNMIERAFDTEADTQPARIVASRYEGQSVIVADDGRTIFQP